MFVGECKVWVMDSGVNFSLKSKFNIRLYTVEERQYLVVSLCLQSKLKCHPRIYKESVL